MAREFGRHGAYICEGCREPHPVTHLSVFPSGNEFLVCSQAAAESLDSGAVIRQIHG